MSTVTAKQLAFCEYVAQGYTNTESYRLAYNTQCSDIQVHQRASSLRNHNSNVIDTINSLMASNQELNSLTREAVIADLVKIAKDTENVKPSDRIKSYGLICQISGFLVSKIESTSTNTSISLSMDQLTINELLKIANIPLVLESPGVIDSSVADSESDG